MKEVHYDKPELEIVEIRTGQCMLVSSNPEITGSDYDGWN